jgi:phage baseplate assembly protein gpV
MSDDLINLIHREIDRALTARHHERVGLVTSYDKTAHAAKVMLQPEGFETGWLPIHGHHVGNGWGMVVGLQIHDQVRVSFQEGDLETGAITARIHSDDDKPPQVESGEMLLKHQSGATIKFANDKSLTITDADGSTWSYDGSGNLHVKAKSVKYESADIQFVGPA